MVTFVALRVMLTESMGSYFSIVRLIINPFLSNDLHRLCKFLPKTVSKTGQAQRSLFRELYSSQEGMKKLLSPTIQAKSELRKLWVYFPKCLKIVWKQNEAYE